MLTRSSSGENVQPLKPAIALRNRSCCRGKVAADDRNSTRSSSLRQPRFAHPFDTMLEPGRALNRAQVWHPQVWNQSIRACEDAKANLAPA